MKRIGFRVRIWMLGGWLALAIFIFSSFAVSQTRPEGSPVLQRDRPSVYLSFNSRKEDTSICRGEGGSQIVLRLHNNTGGYLNVSGFPIAYVRDDFITLADGARVKVLPDGTEVGMCYDVEGMFTRKGLSDIHRAEKTPARAQPYCSCAFLADEPSIEYPKNIGFWIKPGESILFSVPEKYFGPNLKVSTIFNYPSEFVEGRLRRNEPRHRVYFYFTDMPGYKP